MADIDKEEKNNASFILQCLGYAAIGAAAALAVVVVVASLASGVGTLGLAVASVGFPWIPVVIFAAIALLLTGIGCGTASSPDYVVYNPSVDCGPSSYGLFYDHHCHTPVIAPCVPPVVEVYHPHHHSHPGYVEHSHNHHHLGF